MVFSLFSRRNQIGLQKFEHRANELQAQYHDTAAKLRYINNISQWLRKRRTSIKSLLGQPTDSCSSVTADRVVAMSSCEDNNNRHTRTTYRVLLYARTTYKILYEVLL